mmetsp:Transcript_1339/g.2170  ORF Transcript_1339/g.2170 Transcript_1339/m.2170 type:complete len:97 (+) Transcript_1339:185-475(+)
MHRVVSGVSSLHRMNWCSRAGQIARVDASVEDCVEFLNFPPMFFHESLIWKKSVLQQVGCCARKATAPCEKSAMLRISETILKYKSYFFLSLQKLE